MLSTPFVLQRSCCIDTSHQCSTGFVIWTVTTFIAQRPRDNAGVMLTPVHHGRHTIQKSLFPIGVACQIP